MLGIFERSFMMKRQVI